MLERDLISFRHMGQRTLFLLNGRYCTYEIAINTPHRMCDHSGLIFVADDLASLTGIY
jgi:hypothetical protein